MKTNFRTIVLTLALGFAASHAFAQEILTGFQRETSTKTTHYVNETGIVLPFFDDFSQTSVYPDSTKWTDRNAMVTDGFPLNPPTRNAATLDVLDQYGRVYDYAISNAFVAEYLTSARIRLDSVFEPLPKALTPADSLYFSFWYQPQGNGNPPEAQDSLVLQFGTATERQEFLYLDYQSFSLAEIFAEMQVDTLFPGDTVWSFGSCIPGLFVIITDTLTSQTQGQIAIPCDSVFTTVADTVWTHVWSVPGQRLSEFVAENHGQYFKQVMVPIHDVKYFTDHFYFRFYNYASIVNSSLPSSRGNEDIWNIDFVYLDLNRSVSDTAYSKIAFSGRRPSFLNRYQAMPYRQYRVNPNAAVRESLAIDIANLDNVPHEANYCYTVRQIGGNQHYTRFVDATVVNPYLESGYLECPESGESPACPFVGELFALNMWYDSVSYEIKHFVYDSTFAPPLVDSMVYRQGFYNYYAYDDGIPEMGYGVEPANGRFAVRFEMAEYDTIQGVQLLFNHTLNDANNKYFDIAIWKDENGRPGDEVYRLSGQRPQWGDQAYQFQYYRFDQPVMLSGSFYIGLVQQGNGLINIGFDASIDNSQYNFYNVNGSWQPSEMHGTLMIRPVVGPSYYIGVEEFESAKPSVQLYPNPVGNTLNINVQDNTEIVKTCICDLMGRRLFQGAFEPSVSVADLVEGMYFIRFTTAEGQIITQKFIIRK
ncbi:MAG: T9SS type A sorting domain-containing protein [Bacteroidales bacterium]|nr:T9SS type A sorting domain-containing protein [Bacteroidales bacterium]